ncbi:MAG: hypothetical protein H6734_25840 [Alphaproteobacteria bacterium]|nr:hypothetical protein [Alphaproteobacteria bacterium]
MNRLLTAAAASLLCTSALAGYGSSSEKKDSRFGEGAFAISAALDSNLETAWQCNPEQDNVGQWLQIDIPTAGVDKIALVTGWAKSEDTFKDYARVKSATVEVFSKGIGGGEEKIGEQKVSFKDEMGWQIVDLNDMKISGELGGSVKLTVNEVYPGVDYPNLAIGEMRVHLVEFPAETLMLAEDPPAADDKHEAPNMLDGKATTFFFAQGNSLTMTAKAGGYGLSSVGIQAGPPTHARPKTVVLKANDAEIKHVIPENAKGMQWLLLPTIVGYTGSAWGGVEIQIVDSWPGTKAENPLAIAELKVNAATLDDF